MATNPDALPFSGAAERNKAPILDVLAGALAPGGSVLEIASGTGQHAAHFAAAQPSWRWQPSEADGAALSVIDRRCAGLPNVRAAIRLDVFAWPRWHERFDAVYCANLLHIAPWPACGALMRGAAGQLAPGGRLVLYGPFIVDGEPTAAGNVAFDADLRARCPDWGLRRLADVAAQAEAAGLALAHRVAMPANNLALVFERDR